MAKNPIGISFDWGRATYYDLLPSVKVFPKGAGQDFVISFKWLKWYFEVAVS